MSYYHVAPRTARTAIEQLGLLVASPTPRWAKYAAGVQPPGVYFWDTAARAMEWAKDFARLVRDPTLGACDIWRVALDEADLIQVDPILGDQGARFVAYSVEPARLSLAIQR